MSDAEKTFAADLLPPVFSSAMRPLTFLATLLLLALIQSAATATGTNTSLEQEYAQVRKIAMKDPKVQEAFRKANERLNDRILEIDPGLKQVVLQHESTPTVTGTQPVALEYRPATSPTTEGRHHIVAKGETLSTIAAHYKVKVSVLEKVNHITDDRKLQVGQNLEIPSNEAAQPEASPDSAGTQPKDNGDLWDRLKNNL